MRVLVTGSRGLVGSALTRGLREAGIAVDTVTRLEGLETPTRCDVLEDGSREWLVAWPFGLQEIPFEQYDTVIHLAIPPISGREPVEEVIDAHTKPVELLVAGIAKSGSACVLLFVSSQSAGNHSTSRYGRGKWEAEQVLRRAAIPWTIMRPGLIVAPTSRGLFASIVKLVQLSPIIIVPSGKEVVVAPVVLRDVVAACLAIVRAPRRYVSQTYELALPAMPLKDLVRDVSALLGRSRWLLPVNWRWFAFALKASASMPTKLLSYRESLLGLVSRQGGTMNLGSESLGIELHPITKESLPLGGTTPPPSEGEYLFRALFRTTPPPDLLVRYDHYQHPTLLNGTWIDIEKIINKRLNVEAIEFAVRRRNTILTQKMMILCYISELFPSCAPCFINTKSSRLRAFAVLATSGLRAAWSLTYGTYLTRRHSLLRPKLEAEALLTRART